MCVPPFELVPTHPPRLGGRSGRPVPSSGVAPRRDPRSLGSCGSGKGLARPNSTSSLGSDPPTRLGPRPRLPGASPPPRVCFCLGVSRRQVSADRGPRPTHVGLLGRGTEPGAEVLFFPPGWGPAARGRSTAEVGTGERDVIYVRPKKRLYKKTDLRVSPRLLPPRGGKISRDEVSPGGPRAGAGRRTGRLIPAGRVGS